MSSIVQTQSDHTSLSSDADELLRRDVRLLGNLLGETIKKQHGESLYQLVEEVRSLAKDARKGKLDDNNNLAGRLAKLSSEELLHLAKALTLFLNLANIAEQHHQMRLRKDESEQNSGENLTGFLEEELGKLIDSGIDENTLFEHIGKLSIDLILTAHPTEIMRRSVSSKFLRIAKLLQARDQLHLSNFERYQNKQALHRAITEVWETDVIRRLRPTPVDEAKSGIVAIEQTLWNVVPNVVRELDHAVTSLTGKRLPLDAVPIKFGSWMGGDRDGNPNTTLNVTQNVIYFSRWKAADLFWEEIDELRRELSMYECNDALREEVGDAPEPYRALLERVQAKLSRTSKHYQDLFEGRHSTADIYEFNEELRSPLMLCFMSLCAMGDELIAEGRLIDIIRRLDTFGLSLMKLDIRQESDRHAEAINAITEYLGMGSYLEWDEEAKQAFLIKELQSKRPLISSSFPSGDEVNENVAEVLGTFRMLSRQNPESFGAYVISMAESPSDVLAVELLQKECRVKSPLRVVPLFERLDALQDAAQTMEKLFNIDWYKQHINGRQEVMIGYSDSAKDAGKLAASWGLYEAQEGLVKVFENHGVHMTLFHGRGGTVARGGGPAYDAILSQPPGSVNCSMRVTEQGEVIQAKYALPGMAEESLQVYIGAVLEATLTPPPMPKPEWRAQMKVLSENALDEFHEIVRHHPDFVDYFRLATPEDELANLKIGSRPARRRKGVGIQYLRAIPWIFAWTQTRLMLPAWLGVGKGLKEALKNDDKGVLKEMQKEWPFFSATMDSIEMVFSKADSVVSKIYDDRLVPDKYKELGEDIRNRAAQTMELVLEVTGHEVPLETQSIVRRSIDVRNTYVDPLNILQVELLARARNGQEEEVHDALMVAINGIAAGMRNTG